MYYDRLERLFVKGHILDAKRQRWFLAKLRQELEKLLEVHSYQNMDEFLSTIVKMEKMLVEKGETPYESL